MRVESAFLDGTIEDLPGQRFCLDPSTRPMCTVRLTAHFNVCLLVMSAVATAADRAAIDFDNNLQPILTRQGCNQGACHGKARGQGGFQLSLLGFDSNFDHDAITKQARGRRVFVAAPEHSLLLRKAVSATPTHPTHN